MASSLLVPKPLTSSIWGVGSLEQSSLWPNCTTQGGGYEGKQRKRQRARLVLTSGSSRRHALVSECKLGHNGEAEGEPHQKGDSQRTGLKTSVKASKWSVEVEWKTFLAPPTPLKLYLGVYPFLNLDPLGVFPTDDTYINVDPLGVFAPFTSGDRFVSLLLESGILRQNPKKSVPKVGSSVPRMRSVPSLSQMGKQAVAAALKLQADLSTLQKPAIPGFAPPARPRYADHPQRRKPRNKFLDGNFRPVENEEVAELSCQVLGTIPKGLRGRLLRNGPNPQFPPTPSQYHWFDGDGMVHCVRFHEGGASYSSRYVQTGAFLDERAAGQGLYVGLGAFTNFMQASHLVAASQLRSMVSRALRPRIRDTPPWCGMKNPANNHLILHAGRLLALWEAGYPYELDAAQLSTKGVQAFDGQLNSSFTAHPKVDPRTGHLMYYGYNLLRKPYLQYGVVDKSGSIVHRADIELNAPVYMHDFAITENYTIFCDCPVVFSIERVVQSHGASKPFVFDPAHPARIGVMPRFGDNSSVQWFRVQPGFVNHVMNAYEEESDGSHGLPPGGTTVVLRGSRFQAFSALNMADMVDPMSANNQVCRLHEWRLHLPSGKVVERSISPVCSDFVCIHPSYTGVKHRYGYSAHYEMQPGPGNATPMFDGLIKHDVDNATAEVHLYGPDRYGGEPIFVPNSPPPSPPPSHTPPLRSTIGLRINSSFQGLGPKNKRRTPRSNGDGASTREKEEGGEDNGWLVVHVWDEYQKQSEVVVVDAKNVRGPPVARILIPRRVPYGFHGIFVPENE